MADDWERTLSKDLPDLVSFAREAKLEEVEVGDEQRTLRIRLATRAQAAPAATGSDAPDAATAAEPVARAEHVGIFHRGPEDATDPVAEPGDTVEEGAAIGFVDVLGVFHDVPAPFDGAIEAFLVPDGQPVEFGQPIARLTPSD